ncbi:hypothetical protein EK21DRAFT_118185 [Setomelanomma holmii]|uniref:Magnesium transporter CorA n=1 Tax=Setomelanomma holmii TaxID=210430 RepID=A0A9P4GZK9_9PLEO|nr:hypothetical protein EK21DRAFT_118185 [Setomelanomma holmii]
MRPHDTTIVSLLKVLSIIRYAGSEAVQALGHYLTITPRFCNLSYTRLATGDMSSHCLLFSLQFMDMYRPGVVPSETSRLDTSTHHRFRTSTGNNHDHIWHVKCIRLIYLRDISTKEMTEVIQVDPLDDAVANALETLMLRDQEIVLHGTEEYAGLIRLLYNTLYIVTFTWNALFIEAEGHLSFLSGKCLDKNLTPTEQLQYTRELHQLSPIWMQVRRRLVAAKDLVEQLAMHPFFLSSIDTDTQGDFQALLFRRGKIVDDQISRCNQIAEQTNVLVSLIFNIATLQDTKAAVEESKAANALASSIQRVTMLTFIYLLLTLASSIFGMNIIQITTPQSNSPLWAFFILAVALMCATLGGWYIWTLSHSRLQHRASRLAAASNKA